MTVSRTGTTPTPFGFVGKSDYQTDSDTGLMLLGHRYYDPSLGRFISQDPAKDGNNWYDYVKNNPLMKIDPKGLNDKTDHGGQFINLSGTTFIAVTDKELVIPVMLPTGIYYLPPIRLEISFPVPKDYGTDGHTDIDYVKPIGGPWTEIFDRHVTGPTYGWGRWVFGIGGRTNGIGSLPPGYGPGPFDIPDPISTEKAVDLGLEYYVP